MIREAIEALVYGNSLSMDDSAAVMGEIMAGEVSPAQISAFLTALRIKGETPQEMAGMATVMREKALSVDAGDSVVDTCGTGGDSKGTFNISTAAAFVAAASGLKVAKHGNRAASGTCGSADVLEALGVKIDLGPEAVERCIEEVGIGFMFAPTFHPAMRHAAPVRREIGIRTVFNILGPLTNPAGARRQVLGVPNFGLGNVMAEVLSLLGSEHSMVVYGQDGIDELSLGGPNNVWEVRGGQISSYVVDPSELGLPRVGLEEIRGGTAEENARTMRRIFEGEERQLGSVVALNGAAVLMVGGKALDWQEAIDIAREAIDGGEALRRVDALVELSRELAQEAT